MHAKEKMKWCEPGLVQLVVPTSGTCNTGESAFRGGTAGSNCVEGGSASSCVQHGVGASASGQCITVGNNATDSCHGGAGFGV